MKRYLLLIATPEEEAEWNKLKQSYKQKKLGKDLNESIMQLIKNENKKSEATK